MPLKPKNQTNTLKGASVGGGSVQGWTDAQNNVARQVMMYFTQAGASAAGAAGIVGNWMQESSLDPSSAGGYLAQWSTAEGLSGLQSFASQSGLSITSVEAQAKYNIQQLKTSYPSLWQYLTTTKDPRQAALLYSQQFERPGIPMNNRRQDFAAQAYAGISGSASVAGGGGGSGGGGGAPGSILDLLTSPIDTIGGWLASIAVNLLKDTAIGIGDIIIIPAWHWNQRAVAEYLQETKGNQLLWTGMFWGFGYVLLFTDPTQKNLKPAPVRRSRLARHARNAQSLPARMSLVKPKHVKEKTLKKPKPVASRAVVTSTGTMSTTRNQPVKVTGTHVRRTEPEPSGEPSRSEARIAQEGTIATGGKAELNATHGVPNAGHRARSGSLHSSGKTPSNTKKSR